MFVGLLLLESPGANAIEIRLGARRDSDILNQVDARREHAATTANIGIVGDALRETRLLVHLNVVIQFVASGGQSDPHGLCIEIAHHMGMVGVDHRISTNGFLQQSKQGVFCESDIEHRAFLVQFISTLDAEPIVHFLVDEWTPIV